VTKIHAIHYTTRNVITFGAIDDLFERRGTLYRGSHGKEIVLANKNHRQLEESGEVQRFMKGALIDGAVAEKAKSNAIFTSIFASESEAAGQRHMGRHNGVSTVHVMFFIKEMHRTAQPAGTAGIFAEKFRHTGIGAGTAGQSVGMIAIGGDDVIVETRGRDGAGHDCFLADVQMTKTADFLSLILLAG